MGKLSSLFFESGGAPVVGTSDEDLDALLARAYQDGAAGWPSLALPVYEFVRALVRHPSAITSLVRGELHARDFFIATACGASVPRAAETFVRDYLHVLSSTVERTSRPRDEERPDDVLRTVAAQLLVAEGARPARITEYSGRGSLAGWLRVVAARIALNANRRVDRREFRDVPEVRAEVDVELDLFRLQHRAAFKVAFEQSFAELDNEQRLLLRLHACGARGDDMARLAGVDRSTVMRRLARARALVRSATKRNLAQSLSISGAEFDSIARAVASQISVRLSELAPPSRALSPVEDAAPDGLP